MKVLKHYWKYIIDDLRQCEGKGSWSGGRLMTRCIGNYYWPRKKNYKELTTIIRRGATDNKLSREQNSEERWEASLRLSGMAGPSNERWEHWALKPSRPQLFSSLQTIQDSFHFSPRFLLCISLWSSRLEWQQLGYGMLVARRVFWMKIPFIVFNFDLNVCSI